MQKNLNLKFVMISSFAVALTDNEFHPQLIKESSHFVLKACRKIFWSFLKLSKFCIELFNLELEALSKETESVELIPFFLQNSLVDKMTELQINWFSKSFKKFAMSFILSKRALKEIFLNFFCLRGYWATYCSLLCRVGYLLLLALWRFLISHVSWITRNVWKF